jgi:hypothetical protein
MTDADRTAEATPPQVPLSDAPAAAPAGVRRGRRGPRSLAAMLLEVALIGLGVFLGLAGEQWRQDRADRRQAADALRRFRAEIVANRAAVAAVKDYHAQKLQELTAYFAADEGARKTLRVSFEGLKPARFEDTAWDLAIATQSLAHIEPELAFAISRVYRYQALATELERGVIQSMYLRPPSNDDTTFLSTVRLYYNDLTGLEPGLIAAYDGLLTAIDAAMAE